MIAKFLPVMVNTLKGKGVNPAKNKVVAEPFKKFPGLGC